jgi:hypothetical protein
MKNHYTILIFILFFSLNTFAHSETTAINNTVVKGVLDWGVWLPL